MRINRLDEEKLNEFRDFFADMATVLKKKLPKNI